MHEKYMRIALKEAMKSYEIDEVPIGAIIVKDDKIIARAHNTRNKNRSPLDHAEIIAIKKAAKKLGDWRLENCTIYVTIEPCLMCAGAILQSRIDTLVYGGKNTKFGSSGSIVNVFENDNYNHKVNVISGVLESETVEIMKKFFKKIRDNS